ncbi:MAG TPA: RNA-binding S4 domain-containing protein [Bradyrhizobium sp.]|nr:RNA-binding S4 domain-containing protein [Bradyrhizobium sp.]
MKGDGASAEVLGRRLDQWLWFARLVKSRSLAARLCAGRAVMVNQAAVNKANHLVRMGDIIAAPQGAFRRTVRVLGVGTRRGPPAEARRLYEEVAAPVHRSELTPSWTPLLSEDDPIGTDHETGHAALIQSNSVRRDAH